MGRVLRGASGRPALRAELERRLSEIPGLTRRSPSRFGHGFAYYVGTREVAHFHGDERLDVRLTRPVIREHLSEGTLDPRVRTRGSSAEWVTVPLEAPTDLALAVSLLEEAVRSNA